MEFHRFVPNIQFTCSVLVTTFMRIKHHGQLGELSSSFGSELTEDDLAKASQEGNTDSASAHASECDYLAEAPEFLDLSSCAPEVGRLPLLLQIC